MLCLSVFVKSLESINSVEGVTTYKLFYYAPLGQWRISTEAEGKFNSCWFLEKMFCCRQASQLPPEIYGWPVLAAYERKKANDRCCQPCGFLANLVLVFSELVFGLILFVICLYLGMFLQVSVLRITCFPNIMELSLLQSTVKRKLGVFLCQLAQLGLASSDFPLFCFEFTGLLFTIFQFSCKKHFEHVFGWIAYFGLVFSGLLVFVK